MGSVRYLLDTCVFIWLCAEPNRLSRIVAERLDADGTTLVVSDASALEIVLKWTAGKLHLPEPPRSWVEHQIQAWSLEQVPVSRKVMYRASELPTHHGDPFDRLLVASAIEHEATLVTPDESIHRYPVAWIW